MQVFIQRLGHNFQTRRLHTIGVIVGLAVAGFVIGWVLDGIVWIGPIILLISMPATFWGASYIPKLGWFFGRDAKAGEAEEIDEPVEDKQSEAITLNSDGTLPQDITQIGDTVVSGHPANEQADIAHNALVPRSTPVGTTIVTLRPERATLRVKSVIHFWHWFAPLALSVVAFFGAPVGSWIAVATYRSSRPWHQFEVEEAFNAGLTGAVIVFTGFMVAAIWSYFANRPDVHVSITPEIIRYGSMVFDRSHAVGMRMGYETKSAEIRTNITDDSFGVTRLRLAYGLWGEDLKYMVNTYHAPEIVIWLNEIIDGVGDKQAKTHDPYAGRKVELL